MKTITNIAIAFALSLSAAAVGCSPATSASPSKTATTSAQILDGHRYTAKGVLPNGEEITSDLSFAGGMFESSVCTAYGFAPAAYTAGRDGDAITFRAVLRAKDGNVETWAGRIVGNDIEGTVTEADGTTIPFRGKAI